MMGGGSNPESSEPSSDRAVSKLRRASPMTSQLRSLMTSHPASNLSLPIRMESRSASVSLSKSDQFWKQNEKVSPKIQLGSGCSTAVDQTPCDREAVGSNPAGC